MFERIQHLSSAMAGGNPAAVDAFYRQYFDWMYHHARRVTRRDESFCLDVVQDAVLRVIRSVKPVDSEARFRSWLALVVKTTAFDLLRREVRRTNREAMSGVSQLQVNSDSLQLDWLRERIASLDPDLVDLIELRFTQSWSLRRIGEKLGLSTGAVDGRLRRALKKLQWPIDEPPAESVAAARAPLPGFPAENGNVVVAATEDLPVTEALDIELDQFQSPAVELAQVDPGPEITISSDPKPDERLVEIPAVEIQSDIAIAPSVSEVLIAEIAQTVLSQSEVELTQGPVVLPEPSPVPEAEVAVESAVIDEPELVGLEDEAGAYDDKI